MLISARGQARSATTAGFVRITQHGANCSGQLASRSGQLSRPALSRPCWRSHWRWQSTAAAASSRLPQDALRATGVHASAPRKSLAIESKARFNEVGVQHISSHMFEQLFPAGEKRAPPELAKLSQDHLTRHNLYGKNTGNMAPIAFDIPALQGQTLDEHFHKLAVDCAEPYLTLAKQFAETRAPLKPKQWVHRSGWTRYRTRRGTQGETMVVADAVQAPNETMLCFDIEVLYQESPFAVMACAMSPTAWYTWLSPWLLGESESDRHLIPLGDPTHDRIIVGHNVGYDRSSVLEEYDLKQTRNFFMDTMSLHVAVNGMCSQQRPKWMKHKKSQELREKIADETDNMELASLLSDDRWEVDKEAWIDKSSVNSLLEVAKFHLNATLDKSIRNDFGELNRSGIVAKLDELLDYCASDVDITHRIYQAVFPNFLSVCPHPVSFAALRHLSSVILPVDKSWEDYINTSEAKYQELLDGVRQRLIGLTEKALELKDVKEEWQSDPWLSQLDWSGQEIKMTKETKKSPPRPVANQKMPGMPQWYKSLFVKKDGPINLTVRTRIAPLLLKLSWDGFPLYWSDKYGWVFRVPNRETENYAATQLVKCDMSDEENPALKDDRRGVYYKLPHKDGPDSRCSNPLAKSYLAYFEKGILSSEYSYAKEALEMNASCSYWISARDRITSQMVVYDADKPANGKNATANEYMQGYILPRIIPMGTITRRAVENTWLTASNAKKNRVGSELKSMVRAPPGYCFVGADVDSEELWIASVIGDATFKLHGGNAIGFMTLEGTKAAGTDLHSRTAEILGITRNDAKVFNYGRIYGAGVKFASTLLRQFNPSLSDGETVETATKLYAATKGTKTVIKALHPRPFWRGGTESFVFNKLEEFAEQEHPRTPVLGAGITEALTSRYLSKGGYLTSRINWAIQSSGVDYLHLLVVSMDYLIRRYNIDARLSITVHDEIRYLVKMKDRYRAAMALQVANLWTRAMFAQQIGIPDLPQSCAYFSAVDVDTVLRKEVDMTCITPSNKTAIPPGESVTIEQLLEKGEAAYLDPSIMPVNAPQLDHIHYEERTPVMESLGRSASADNLTFLKAQITKDEEDLKQIVQSLKKAKVARNSGGWCDAPLPERKRATKPYNSKDTDLPPLLKTLGSTKFTNSKPDAAGWEYDKPPPSKRAGGLGSGWL